MERKQWREVVGGKKILFFKDKNFAHRQGSGYVSNKKLSSADIVDIIGDLQKSFSWTETCIKKIDVTNVGTQYDLTELLQPSDIEDTIIPITPIRPHIADILNDISYFRLIKAYGLGLKEKNETIDFTAF